MKFVLNRPDAVVPTRAYANDIGYDLTAISLDKKVNDNGYLFNTHVSVRPPDGFYLEILPRSSLSKSGYMLANSVGTIDPSYTGDLKIALVKVDPSAPNLELPFKLCQLVMRRAHQYEMAQVSSLEVTERGDGGFGSSDNLKK